MKKNTSKIENKGISVLNYLIENGNMLIFY